MEFDCLPHNHGNQVCLLRVLTQYLRRAETRAFKNVRYICPILTKIVMFGQTLIKLPNIKFHENPLSRSRITRVQTDGSWWVFERAYWFRNSYSDQKLLKSVFLPFLSRLSAFTPSDLQFSLSLAWFGDFSTADTTLNRCLRANWRSTLCSSFSSRYAI
jgi:hypothetical protein